MTAADAPQPDLRSFIVYGRLPAGCAAWPVTNGRCEPHLHVGELVIVDPSDTEPCEGELFLIKWKGATEPSIAVMEMRESEFRHGRDWRWWIGDPAPTAMMDLGGRPAGPLMRWADGPYETGYAREITLGRIVGILQPAFVEPQRAIA